MKVMNVVVYTHYARDDKEFAYDYYQIDVEVDGVIVDSYGDEYHDSGEAASKGFLAGLTFMADLHNVEVNIEYQDMADYDD